jgi:hypothetical protein
MSKAKNHNAPAELPSGDAKLLPLAELATRLPAVRSGRPVHRATLYKWATVGLLNRAGYRVRLPTQFIGGRRCASMDDLRRFFDTKKDADFVPEKRLSMTQNEKTAIRRRGQDALDWFKRRGF